MKISEDVKESFADDYKSRLSNLAGTDELYNYIKSIIEINSINPDAFSGHLKIFFLKKIIGTLRAANQNEYARKMEIDDWSADDWKDSKDEISFMQVRLKSCKVGQLIA